MRHLIFVSLFFSSLTAAVVADEYQIDLHFCYGNSSQLLVEGRVIEQRNASPAKASDNMFSNIWRSLQRLVNDEEEYAKISLLIGSRMFTIRSDEEGYFRFTLPLNDESLSESLTIQLQAENTKLNSQCSLFLPGQANSVGIISDFDDTVVVSDVTDKTKLLLNILTKNYKQREVVEGMSAFYRRLLMTNHEQALLIFLTGSPRQIQKSIEAFLNYHNFPSRIVLTKKLNGENSDPIFDQFKYKTEKIIALLEFFPEIDFVLVGDDGEKDPEVYDYIQMQFPGRIKDVWIRQVSSDSQQQRYAGQQLFVENPGG